MGQPGHHRKHLCSDTAPAHFFYFLIYTSSFTFSFLQTCSQHHLRLSGPFTYLHLFLSASTQTSSWCLPSPSQPAEKAQLPGAQVGQEAAGGWAAGREVWLLTWTPEKPLKQEEMIVSPQLLASPGLLPPDVQEPFWKQEKNSHMEVTEFPIST